MPRYRVTLKSGKTFTLQAATENEARDRVHGRLAGMVRQAERESGSNSQRAKNARFVNKEPFKVEKDS